MNWKCKKFAEKCGGSSLAYLTMNWKCTRRVKHMMRAMKLMTKAQDDELMKTVPPEQRAKEQDLLQGSLQNMAAAMGEDGAFVIMLQEKLKADPAGIKRDPTGKITHAIDLLTKLLKGSEDEKRLARAEIMSMPDHGEPLSSEEEADLKANNTKLAEQLRSQEGDPRHFLDSLDYIAPDNGTESEGALVQMGTGSVATGAEVGAYIIIVLLTIMTIMWIAAEILSLLLLWLLISLFGCTMYHSLNETSVASWSGTKCIAKAFAFPLILAGKAVYAIGEYFSRSGGSSSLAEIRKAGALDADGNACGPSTKASGCKPTCCPMHNFPKGSD